METKTLYTFSGGSIVIRAALDECPDEAPHTPFVNAGDIVQIRQGHRWEVIGTKERGSCTSVDGRFVLPRPDGADGAWIAHTVRRIAHYKANEIKVWRSLDTFASDGTTDTGPDPQPRSRGYWIQRWRDYADAMFGGDFDLYDAEIVLVLDDGSETQLDACGMDWFASAEEALHDAEMVMDITGALECAIAELRTRAHVAAMALAAIETITVD